jgi:putative membrane protein insertion efficiency factor
MRLVRAIDRAVALVARGLVALYRRLLSPLLPPACRFYPTCSAYADEALRRQGFVLGSLLSVRRIVRCHPFAEGGVDPVPAPDGAES